MLAYSFLGQEQDGVRSGTMGPLNSDALHPGKCSSQGQDSVAPDRGWKGYGRNACGRFSCAALISRVRTPGCGMKGTPFIIISTEETLGIGPRTEHIHLLFIYRSEKMTRLISKWTGAGAKLIGKHFKHDRSPCRPEGKQNNMCPVKI